MEADEQGQEEKHPTRMGGETTLCQRELSNVSNGIGRRPGAVGAFLVGTAWQAGETLLAKYFLNGRRTQSVGARALELIANVIDGEITLAEGDDALADGIFAGLRLGTVGDIAKEISVHGVAKAPAENAKGPGLVPEAAGYFCRGQSLEEVGAQGLVLTLPRVFGLPKEALFCNRM